MIYGRKQSEKPWYKKDIYGCVGETKRMRTWSNEGWAIGAMMNLAFARLEPSSSLSPWIQT